MMICPKYSWAASPFITTNFCTSKNFIVNEVISVFSDQGMAFYENSI
jgi:hypothetical protein